MISKISKLMQDKIIKKIEDIWDYGFITTSCTYSDKSIAVKDINNLIEQFRPEYAILLNDSMEYGKIFETENTSLDIYYCKKLLLMNPTYYKDIEDVLYGEGINMKIYRNGKELMILNKLQIFIRQEEN